MRAVARGPWIRGGRVAELAERHARAPVACYCKECQYPESRGRAGVAADFEVQRDEDRWAVSRRWRFLVQPRPTDFSVETKPQNFPCFRRHGAADMLLDRSLFRTA